jgi:hypothetical protein
MIPPGGRNWQLINPLTMKKVWFHRTQIIFIILFGKFVVYNPDNAYSTDSSYPDAIESLQVYPSKNLQPI